MIQAIGLFWRRDNVYWGRGNQRGMLLGVPSGNVTAEPADFREQVGIYALYAEYEIVYVGQTGGGNQKLLHRLKQHRSDDLSERWDRFSWFGLRRVLNSGDLSNVNQAAHPEPIDCARPHGGRSHSRGRAAHESSRWKVR